MTRDELLQKIKEIEWEDLEFKESSKVLPKTLWEKQFEVDDQNCIALNCRSMLIQDDDKTILFETGSGLFFPPNPRESCRLRLWHLHRHH